MRRRNRTPKPRQKAPQRELGTDERPDASSRGFRPRLDRISIVADNLAAPTVKAKSLFDTLGVPQKPDGLRILDLVSQKISETFTACRVPGRGSRSHREASGPCLTCMRWPHETAIHTTPRRRPKPAS